MKAHSRSSNSSRRSGPSWPGSVITFDPDALSARRAELEQRMGEPGFWDDQERAAKISTEHSRVARKLDSYEQLTRDYEDAQELFSMDGGMEEEIASSIAPLRQELEIDEGDLRIDTYRAQGAGGQHVNKTDSAVRITHLPTGVVVQCQNERSQTANKQTAMRILKSRLAELAEEEREQELARERGVVSMGFGGNPIRSYFLQPYQLVKDHRTNYEVGNAQGVLDGNLDPFIHAYLLARAAGKVV